MHLLWFGEQMLNVLLRYEMVLNVQAWANPPATLFHWSLSITVLCFSAQSIYPSGREFLASDFCMRCFKVKEVPLNFGLWRVNPRLKMFHVGGVWASSSHMVFQLLCLSANRLWKKKKTLLYPSHVQYPFWRAPPSCTNGLHKTPALQRFHHGYVGYGFGSNMTQRECH